MKKRFYKPADPNNPPPVPGRRALLKVEGEWLAARPRYWGRRVLDGTAVDATEAETAKTSPKTAKAPKAKRQE